MIQELLSNTNGFGRLVAVDPRDLRYRMSLVGPHLPKVGEAVEDLRVRHWNTGSVKDQGNTSECVAYSGGAWLETGPITNKTSGNFRVWANELYKDCQKVDEWPGEDYDGTSVRALFKVLMRRGFIREYIWANDVIDEIVPWVLTKGPIEVGTDWYQGMMDVNKREFITLTGRPVGGHAYLIKGVNLNMKCPDGSLGAFRIMNSWGRGWGKNGYAWIGLRDFQTLMDRYGEACTAVEISVGAKAVGMEESEQ